MTECRKLNIILFIIFISHSFLLSDQQPEIKPPPQEQVDQYNALKTKTIFELQQFRATSSIQIHTQAGEQGEATLVNLNPYINTWYILTINWDKKTSSPSIYHLENPQPYYNTYLLDAGNPYGIVIKTSKKKYSCNLWLAYQAGPLWDAKKSLLPFSDLCGGYVYVRNKIKGNKTILEAATNFLRRHVFGGEGISRFFKENMYQDKFARTSDMTTYNKSQEPYSKPSLPGSPIPASIDPDYAKDYLEPVELGLLLSDNETGKKLLAGKWYPVQGHEGVFVSVIQPKMVSKEIIKIQRGRVKNLDTIEQTALTFLVAFDLNLYEVGYEIGTENPSVEWSDRILPSMKDKTLPGPDGIGNIDPLNNTGIVRPDNMHRVIATFAGGFKRYHGAFMNGPLALKNHGSHYGFIEYGVVQSKLLPGLATIIILNDDSVILKTWQEADAKLLLSIRHARQNGVPIIELDSSKGVVLPTTYIMNSLFGNWSGSSEGTYRTLRAGIALQENLKSRYLIYGYFSTATPSAMARIFQSYHCTYAMLTDMNALEHTYMALYTHNDMGIQINHIVTGMNVLDKNINNIPVPRFLGFPDNRDFFYIMKKQTK